jgi:uncharacterized protein (TIGR02266 family)
MSDSWAAGLGGEESEVIINRRESDRKRVRVAVSMHSDSNLYVGFADNMSEGGLFVATHELLSIGETIELVFELPGEEDLVEVKAEVCWQRAVSDVHNGMLPGFGARFVDLDDADRARLEQFLESREPIFHPE